MSNIKEIVAIIEACRLWRFVKKIKSAFGDKVGRQIKQFKNKLLDMPFSVMHSTLDSEPYK